MQWIPFAATLAFSFACVVLGVICLKRRRRVLGALLIVLGALVLVAPVATLEIKVDLPPVAPR